MHTRISHQKRVIKCLCLLNKKQRWLGYMGEISPIPPNQAHVMSDVLRVISDDEDIDSAGTSIECAVSNDD